ncbi:hypothetical protein [Domibacillus epiphyticus]|uniref:Uncharacterized protein n=1 Tax=Domibacillus epiphyticus TaxID=1714355 RepID=A0A1V2ACG0_9BACI|nr:hypothetical protein [Domibacillus epiphyticus]OMP68686.1 hypothetical protein BTO28_01150 [Domibacillus epiphyticus]
MHKDFGAQEHDIYNRIIYTSFTCQIPVRVEVQAFNESTFYGIVQSLNSFRGRLELEGGSYCIKDIVSLSLDWDAAALKFDYRNQILKLPLCGSVVFFLSSFHPSMSTALVKVRQSST